MAKTCSSCKTVSESGEGYRELSAFSPGVYCPVCYRKEAAATSKRSLIYLFLGMGFVGLIVWLTKLFKPGQDLTIEWVGLNVYLCLIFQFVVTLPHELGHAVSARLLGLKVFKISAGIGPPMWKGTLLGGNVEVNRYPFGGYTIFLDNREQGFRLRHWIAVGCGPLVNFLFVLAALAFLPRPVRMGTLSEGWDPVKAFLAANLLTLFFNLLPRRTNTSLGVRMTDGLQLLRTPFMKETEIRTQLSLGYALPGALALQEGRKEDAMRIYYEGIQAFPESLLLRLDRCVALIDLEKCEEARRELHSLLENPQLEKGLRPFCLNNLAAADITLGQPELLDEADRCSTEAMAIMAWSPVTKAARAAVLVERGRLDEGIALARQSIDQQEGDKSKKWNAVTLAIAYKRKGEEVEGRKFFDLAVRAGPDGPRMRRAREMYGLGIAQ